MKKIYITIVLCLSVSVMLADTPIIVHTGGGKNVDGIVRSEMTIQEINALNDFATTTYSNATFLGNSSTTYNCHSYAWNMARGGTTCWINAGTNNSNISKYWTNDHYRLTTNTATFTKIFYPSGDHSAIKSSVPGMYESKWGPGPLMRHAPGYGPYANMENRQYYELFYSGTVSGPVTLLPGNSYGFSVPYMSSVSYVWIILNHKEAEVDVPITSSGYSMSVTLTQTGFYEIHCNLYDIPGNNHIGSYALYDVFIM
jgi:hypothetical protein